MANWIRWWKDRAFLLILLIAFSSMILALVTALIVDWGWILSVVYAIAGGVLIRLVIRREIEKKVKDGTNSNL